MLQCLLSLCCSHPANWFELKAGGQVKLGISQWAKRGLSASVPVVDLDKCTRCNKCEAICPPQWPILSSPSRRSSSRHQRALRHARPPSPSLPPRWVGLLLEGRLWPVAGETPRGDAKGCTLAASSRGLLKCATHVICQEVRPGGPA